MHVSEFSLRVKRYFKLILWVIQETALKERR